jgi:hypothetical protein
MNASALVIGKSYCLRLPDGRSLGHVRVERLNDSWAEGPFTPTSTYAEFHQLFERADQLAKDQIVPLWEEAADAIDALGIQVIDDRAQTHHNGLRVFVIGSEASIGPPLCMT